MEDRTDLLREASWDQERLKDLPLDEGSGVAAEETRRIIGSIAPDLQRLVKAKQLTPYLPKRDIASSEAEYQELTKENSTECERAQCLRDILFAAGRCSRPRAFLRNLYLALLDSFENDSGLANHRYLAVNCLREQVLHVQGIDRQEHANKQKDLPTIAKNLTPVSISRNDALALRQKLGLESEAASESTECVGRICEEWLQKVSQCSLVRLVKALLCVPGLGRLVSQLVPLCFCNTRKVYNFVRCLQQHWQQLALYLGYSQEEVDAIVEHCPPDDVNSQIKMFLRLWWMPDCGTRTQAILDELKACAGITSAPDTQIYCPHKTKGRDGGDERTDVVPSNVVNFYQSFYCLPPGSTVQGAVHGAIAGAGVCAQHPQGGVAFNPATGFGVPAIPFSPWPAACTQPLPPTAHTVPTEQANVQILPESSNQLVTETKDTPPQTSSKIVTVEQPVTEVPPLAEDSALLPRHSGLEPEEQQPKVDNEMCEPTVDHTTVHNAVRDESRNEGAALLAACMNSEWDMGKALVNSGSFLEARSHQDGKTPLLHTCIKGEVAFVKYLVKEHADITAQDSQGHCCLHFREVLKNEALMKYLLSIFTLLDISIDIPNENKCTPLLAACNLGDSVAHSVHLLLHHEANPDGNNHAQCRPLVEASARDHERTVKLLLQYNANPDIQDMSGCTALLKACKCRQSNIIRLLLEHGVSVNRSDHDGTTPLFSAVSSNAYEVVHQLIQKGAHINITRYCTNPIMSGAVEETPLAQACAKGFQDIVELLILYGADVNYLCSGTLPPLGFAVVGKQMHIVKCLLENSDINKSLRGLRAPIIIAMKVQNIACAKLMITELGGEEKALMMAKQQKMYQLAEHIELYMALKKDIPDSVLEEMGGYNPVQAHVQDPSYYKTGEVMQSFSEVCVAAVISVATREGTASVITDQHRCAGEFLNRCINGTQRSEMLRPDLMSGDPSPFKFFIDNHLLTADDFQIQAFERYGDNALKFCGELVETFRQLPGGESLPNDINIILMRLFSGQLGIGCLTTSSHSGRDSLPQELLPWYDSKYKSSVRQSQPSPIPQSDKKLFEEAMKEGYVNASFLKIIFTGAGGVGKTHAFCLLRGVDPPDPNHRQSTDCVTKAVTLRVDAANDEEWEEIDLEKRKKIIAEGICQARKSFKLKETTPTTSSPQPQPVPKPKPEPETEPKPQLKVQREQQSPQSKTELDLVQCIHEAIMSGEVSGEVLGTKWVYAVDTGGQPPFHELLSAFIEGASVCAFVFKLSENLDHRPLVEYWVDGTEVGQPFEHPLSNQQILEQSIQTVQALPSLSNECAYSMSPLLLVIGTHRDKQNECPDETLEDKEKTLHDIIEKSGCNFQFNPHSDIERVVFDVNAKNPEQRDKELASTLRRVIANRMPEPKKIPLRHYGLELELEHLATTKGVISMEECRAIGGRLNFDEKGLKAALRFLHKLNVLLYYPEVKEVKELVFCDPLVLIKIASKVSEHIHKGENTAWKDSRERGLVTVEQLNGAEFDRCFQSQLFTAEHLFKLFEHLLIVAMVKSNQQFFMPSLLNELTTTELEKKRPYSPHCNPLTFQFRTEGRSVYAPSGLFSALVAFLLSLKTRYSELCSWEISEIRGTLYRNIIRFQSHLPLVDITLMNFHTHFEVFAICQPNVNHMYLPEIRKVINKGIVEVKKVRNFDHVNYNEAFTCKCSKAANKPHLAVIDIKGKRWCCPVDKSQGGPLEPTELVWFHNSPAIGVGGNSCEGTAGFSKLQCKRDTIINSLADLGLTRDLAERLFGAGMITRRIYDQARNFAPGEVEVDRATGLFNAVLASVELNPMKYDMFISILMEMPGSEDIVSFIEGTEPCVQSAVPQITKEPDSLENVAPGKPAKFVVKAIGKNLTYTWYRQATKQLLPNEKRVFVGNTQILKFDKVEPRDEGYYVCSISNPTGGSVRTSPAQLQLIPQITKEPHSLEGAILGEPAQFVVKANESHLTYTWYRQTTKQLLPNEKRVSVGNTQILRINKVELSDEGYYVCTICNTTGGSVETKPARLTTIPQITEEPDSLENLAPGKPAEFVVKATGKNLTYTWHRQATRQLLPKANRVFVGGTQIPKPLFQTEGRVYVGDTPILRIDKVEPSNEGYYVCTISNSTGGSVETNPVQLTTIPHITEEPVSLENVTPGKPAEFTVKATGINLTYTWLWQTPEHLFPQNRRGYVGNAQILRINKVVSNDEGYYCCVICNSTGGKVETFPAQLTTIPQITKEPDSLENVAPGIPAEFVVKANGNHLAYAWYRQATEEILPIDKRVIVGNTQILHIEKVESSDEGNYVCIISNPTGGTAETKPAQLRLSPCTIPQITEEPHSLEDAILGEPAEFVVKANGSHLTYTWYHQTTKELLPNEKRVSVGNTQILCIDKVKPSDEGYYICNISNTTGGSVETNPAQLTTIPQITEEPHSLEDVAPGKPAEFVVKAIGKNLAYTWYHQTTKQFLPNDKKVIVGNAQILRIDKVKSSNEGYYICTICNSTGGSVETIPVQLTTIPQITEEPHSLENVILGKSAEFVVKVNGSHLTYAWYHQATKQLLPNEKRVSVGNTCTQILHIDKVESSDEGYYVCTISNPTGGSVDTSPAQLQLTTIPQITEEPHSLENVAPGKPAEFVVKAIGTNLIYTWHRQTAKQLLPNDKRVFVGNAQILHIKKVQSSNEGYYVCTICNPTGGSVETNPVQLTTIPQITEEPHSLINLALGKPAEFAVKAIGKNLTYTWYRQTAKELLLNDTRVIVGNTEILFIDKVEPSDEGYYVCRICNTTGGSVETVSAELTTSWQFDPFDPAVGGSPMRQEQKHNLGLQTSLPVKEREQRLLKKNSTEQTGATSSQSETDHHEPSDPPTVPCGRKSGG